MLEYNELIRRVQNTMQTKSGPYTGITAVKAETPEQYSLARCMWAAGKSSCYHVVAPAELEGEFTGPDWYMLETKHIEMGMDGSWDEYRVESLTEKKAKFAQYCAQFEEEKPNERCN